MRRHRSPTRWGGVISAGSSTGAHLLATQRPAMASTRNKQPSRAITWPVAWGMIMTFSFGVTCASHAITAGRCRLDPEPGGFVPQTRDTTCTHHPRGDMAGHYLAVMASRYLSAHETDYWCPDGISRDGHRPHTAAIVYSRSREFFGHAPRCMGSRAVETFVRFARATQPMPAPSDQSALAQARTGCPFRLWGRFIVRPIGPSARKPQGDSTKCIAVQCILPSDDWDGERQRWMTGGSQCEIC
jgi:hypothetical protein